MFALFLSKWWQDRTDKVLWLVLPRSQGESSCYLWDGVLTFTGVTIVCCHFRKLTSVICFSGCQHKGACMNLCTWTLWSDFFLNLLHLWGCIKKMHGKQSKHANMMPRQWWTMSSDFVFLSPRPHPLAPSPSELSIAWGWVCLEVFWMKWMFWHHAGTLHWKAVSCLPRPSLLRCPPSLLFIRRLPMLQHGGVRYHHLATPWSHHLSSARLLSLPVQFKQALKPKMQSRSTVILKECFLDNVGCTESQKWKSIMS